MRIDAQELERQASALSNYSGDDLGYTGYGDDFLEYNGNDQSSFLDAIHKGKSFIFSITNANAATRTALFCPGLNGAATGLIADGAFNDVGGNAGLSATGSPGSINALNLFIRMYPTLVVGFKVTSSNLAQLEQPVTIQRESPFVIEQSRNIIPGMYASESNPNGQLITVGEGFQMDYETRISYPILGGTTVNFALVFGPSLKVSKALTSKANKAAATKQAIIATGAPAAKYIGR